MKKRVFILIKKTIVFTVSAAVLCGTMMMTPTFGDDSSTQNELNEKIAALQAENEKIDKQIAEKDGLISESEDLQYLAYQKLQSEKETIDTYANLIYEKEGEIELTQASIDDTEAIIQQKEAEIEQANIDIDNLNKENKENIEKFGDIIAAAYMNGDTDMVTLLMGATDFYDVLVISEILQNTGNRNEEFMESLMASIADLDEKKIQLEGDIEICQKYKDNLESDKADLESQKAELVDTKTQSEALSEQYLADYSNYKAYISDIEYQKSNLEYQKKINAQEAAAFEKQLEALIRAAQNDDKEYVEGDWAWPLDHNYHMVFTYFGYDAWRGSSHSGVDIGDAGIGGANIYAMKSGTVIKAVTSYTPGYSYGMYIVIDHGGGYTSLYGHCSAIYVSVGQEVSQGDVIGAVGTTGWSTGNHLHFEVRIDGVAQDPFNYIEKFW